MPGIDIMHDVEEYAKGNLSVCDELDLFQRLADTGLAWKTGDTIARVANQLLIRGKISVSDETPVEIKSSIKMRQSAITCLRNKEEKGKEISHGNERENGTNGTRYSER